ncbi:hypothetical protein D3C75_1263390 [compost metagenome]
MVQQLEWGQRGLAQLSQHPVLPNPPGVEQAAYQLLLAIRLGDGAILGQAQAVGGVVQ